MRLASLAVTSLVLCRLGLENVIQPWFDNRMTLIDKVLRELACRRVLEFTLASPRAVPKHPSVAQPVALTLNKLFNPWHVNVGFLSRLQNSP